MFTYIYIYIYIYIHTYMYTYELQFVMFARGIRWGMATYTNCASVTNQMHK